MYDGYVIITTPPNEVNISEYERSFLGENLSAITPPYKYDKKATIPYVENNAPSSRFVRLKISKKVGLKTLAKTYGRIYIDSAAKISVSRYM
tara:strand:- start:2927 stop:3202 length:276 start_codon:yes stop_codon:yes gene_type:complete